jgi:hypothetical protein
MYSVHLTLLDFIALIDLIASLFSEPYAKKAPPFHANFLHFYVKLSYGDGSSTRTLKSRSK